MHHPNLAQISSLLKRPDLIPCNAVLQQFWVFMHHPNLVKISSLLKMLDLIPCNAVFCHATPTLQILLSNEYMQQI